MRLYVTDPVSYHYPINVLRVWSAVLYEEERIVGISDHLDNRESESRQRLQEARVEHVNGLRNTRRLRVDQILLDKRREKIANRLAARGIYFVRRTEGDDGTAQRERDRDVFQH